MSDGGQLLQLTLLQAITTDDHNYHDYNAQNNDNNDYNYKTSTSNCKASCVLPETERHLPLQRRLSKVSELRQGTTSRAELSARNAVQPDDLRLRTRLQSILPK